MGSRQSISDAITSPLQEDGVFLQLPKPFSLSTLKNLNLNMILSKRSFADIEKRLIAMDESNPLERSNTMTNVTFTESYKEFAKYQ